MANNSPKIVIVPDKDGNAAFAMSHTDAIKMRGENKTLTQKMAEVDENILNARYNLDVTAIAQSDLRTGAWSDAGASETNTKLLTNSTKFDVTEGMIVSVKLGTNINKGAYKFWANGSTNVTAKSTWLTDDFTYNIPSNGKLILLFGNTDNRVLAKSDYDAEASLITTTEKDKFLTNEKVGDLSIEKELTDSEHGIPTSKVVKENVYIIKNIKDVSSSDLRVGAWSDMGGEQPDMTNVLTNSVIFDVTEGTAIHVTLGTNINRCAYKLWANDGSFSKSEWINVNTTFNIALDGKLVLLFGNTDSSTLGTADYDAEVVVAGNPIKLSDIEQGSWSARKGKQDGDDTVIRVDELIPIKAGKSFTMIPGQVASKVFYRFFPNSGYLPSLGNWSNIVQPSGWSNARLDYTALENGYVAFIFANASNSNIAPSDYDAFVCYETENTLRNAISALDGDVKALGERTSTLEAQEADLEERVETLEQSGGGGTATLPLQIIHPYMRVFKSISEINEEFQSFCKVGNEFWIATGGSGDGGSHQGHIYRYNSSWEHINNGDIQQTGFHFNSMSYDEETDRLITGGVTGTGANYIYIFAGVSNWPTTHASTPITSSDAERIVILSQITNYTNPVWAERNAYGHRAIIVSGELNTKFIKIELGYGTNQLEYGTYTASANGVPNGTYRLIWNRAYTVPTYITNIGSLTQYSNKVCQGIDYYGGKIYVMASVTPSTLIELTPTETGFTSRAIHQLWCDDSGTLITNCANEGVMCLDGKVYVGISAIGEAGSTSITAYNNKILVFDL